MSGEWHEVADALATAMQHSERGLCTMTDAEHAALALYQQARQPSRNFTRMTLGFRGGLDAFRHRHTKADR